MVKQIKEAEKIYFACEKCGLLYKEKIWAEKCEKWCSKNKSCNLEITKHAIKDRDYSLLNHHTISLVGKVK
ncbi:MAG: hypothetical protein NC904_02535 [Candidatus Omnitrophica bacterium]|nr:hypothetical protein [Candidatus Omnitrophota bacterium]